MKKMEKSLSPREGMRRWYERELELFNSRQTGGNDYDPFVPIEVREEFKRLAAKGVIPRLFNSHFALWEALLEAAGWERFDIKLSLPLANGVRCLLGRPPMIKRRQSPCPGTTTVATP